MGIHDRPVHTKGDWHNAKEEKPRYASNRERLSGHWLSKGRFIGVVGCPTSNPSDQVIFTGCEEQHGEITGEGGRRRAVKQSPGRLLK